MRLALVRLFATATLAAAVSCSTRAPPALESAPITPAAPDALEPLRAFEAARRGATDFAHAPTSVEALGTDPYAIRRLPGLPPRYVGILRGRAALVLLDAELHEVARAPAPDSPTGLAVSDAGQIFASGELSRAISRYHVTRGAFVAEAPIDLPDVRAIRDIAMGPHRTLYVVDEHDGRLITLTLDGRPGPRSSTRVGAGAFRVKRAGAHVLVDALLDHAIVVRALGEDGVPLAAEEARITSDGPWWGFDAIDTKEGLLVATGGVEDHPLDRREGSFGFVDSFVTLHRVSAGGVLRLHAVNVSALGVITPKAVTLARAEDGSISVTVTGYGSDRMAVLTWPPDLEGEPATSTRAALPGVTAMERENDGGFVAADPLLDAWVRLPNGEGGASLVHVDDAMSSARSVDSRVGEALFFTSLMAPYNRSDGRLSRFTCETCHFEGTFDGRTHHTGRDDVRATTKPLLGLFNNRPHFSRALDPDLATVANNEFIVAGANSGHDPWFSVARADFPWVRELGVEEASLSPETLRRSLMTFLMEFAHRPNPSAAGRARWSAAEGQGAAVFAAHCESCHAARLVTDDPATRVPQEKWEALVMSREGPLVWASADHAKTGIEPYVSEKGARVVSLRRLYKKRPYFTNGSSRDLASVLDRVRFAPEGDRTAFLHDATGAEARLIGLDAQEKTALLAFLDLL